MKASYSIYFSTLMILLASCGPATTPSATPVHSMPTPKPAWLIQHPVNPAYYIGIGSASKQQYGAEALKSAQDMALADLASQITVTISSDIITTLIEKGELTAEEYQATARSQAIADLEGHEFVDSWQDQNYQYAYYRLSKAKYAAIQAEKRQAATALSTNYFRQAREAANLGNFRDAFISGIQAFEPLLPYINEALTAEIDGEHIILSNAIDQFLKALIGNITLNVNQSHVKAKLGEAVAKDIIVYPLNSEKQKVRFLPLQAKFKKGSGDLVQQLNSGSQGSRAEFSSLCSSSLRFANRAWQSC